MAENENEIDHGSIGTAGSSSHFNPMASTIPQGTFMTSFTLRNPIPTIGSSINGRVDKFSHQLETVSTSNSAASVVNLPSHNYMDTSENGGKYSEYHFMAMLHEELINGTETKNISQDDNMYENSEILVMDGEMFGPLASSTAQQLSHTSPSQSHEVVHQHEGDLLMGRDFKRPRISYDQFPFQETPSESYPTNNHHYYSLSHPRVDHLLADAANVATTISSSADPPEIFKSEKKRKRPEENELLPQPGSNTTALSMPHSVLPARQDGGFSYSKFNFVGDEEDEEDFDEDDYDPEEDDDNDGDASSLRTGYSTSNQTSLLTTSSSSFLTVSNASSGQNSSHHNNSSCSSQDDENLSTNTSQAVKPVSKRRHRKYYDRRVKPFPRVLKRDIRRSYANMLINVMNSSDVELIVKFFTHFCLKNCYLFDDSTEAMQIQPNAMLAMFNGGAGNVSFPYNSSSNPGSSASYPTDLFNNFSQQLLQNNINNNNNTSSSSSGSAQGLSLRQVKGPERIALHMLRGMDLVPDCVVRLKQASIHQYLNTTGSKIVCKVTMSGTKLFTYAVTSGSAMLQSILHETAAQEQVMQVLQMVLGEAAASKLSMDDISQYFQKIMVPDPVDVSFAATITMYLDEEHRIYRLDFTN